MSATSTHFAKLPIIGTTLNKFIAIEYKSEITANAIEINIAWYKLNERYGVIVFFETFAKTIQIILKIPKVKYARIDIILSLYAVFIYLSLILLSMYEFAISR